mmetsp:Transcript_7901/g.16121  ORF Transcript_7901/g.16121 Transcript_7901/m.16121 type:complete len:86 (+) Transcript_7901:70-327(+)
MVGRVYYYYSSYSEVFAIDENFHHWARKVPINREGSCQNHRYQQNSSCFCLHPTNNIIIKEEPSSRKAESKYRQLRCPLPPLNPE